MTNLVILSETNELSNEDSLLFSPPSLMIKLTREEKPGRSGPCPKAQEFGKAGARISKWRHGLNLHCPGIQLVHSGGDFRPLCFDIL